MDEEFKKNYVEPVDMKLVMSPMKVADGLKPRNPNEMVLSIGGWLEGPQGPCSKVEIGAQYGRVSKPWKRMKFPMPFKRGYFGIGLVEQKIYIFGGFYHHPEANEEGYPKSTYEFETISKVYKFSSKLGFVKFPSP